MELQADILAGYWLGGRLKEQEIQLGPYNQPDEIKKILSIARSAAFEVGDFAFSSPDHHGTPNQRHSAVMSGSIAGFSAQFGLTQIAYSQNDNEIYEWSLQKAEQIFKGGDILSPD